MSNRSIFLLSLVLCLSACMSNDSEQTSEQQPEKNKAKLGSVYFAPMPLNHDPIPSKGLEAVRDAYAELQTLVSDPKTREIVKYRLADLEVLLAEQSQEKGLSAEQLSYYQQAIEQYQQVLALYPEREQNSEVLYQLAKAYDLQGDAENSFTTLGQLLTNFPENPHLAEVYFRRGEILFNQSNYVAAINAYENVLAQGNEHPYFVTSAYMLGWSYFKIEQEQKALLAFTRLLDHTLPNEIIYEAMFSQVDSKKQLDAMAVGEKRLVNDAIRIMALLFSYLSSEQSIAAHFDKVGKRHYESLLYEQLGQQYLNDDRFRDSAQVYYAFTERHPDHNKSPFFAVKQIDVYILGKFPTLVLPAKQRFITDYGISGQYWDSWGQLLRDDIKPFLHQYLQELAQFEHSKAQLLVQASTSDELSAELLQQRKTQSIEAFVAASEYYDEFIQTFPTDAKTPEMTFNMAESLFDAGRFEQAVEAYETYAYQYSDEPQAAEAGYAAILSYSEIINTQVEPQQISLWQERQLDSQARFVQGFATDSRASNVLYTRMQTLFELDRFQLALEAATQLTQWLPKVDNDQQKASMLVIAHSQFELLDYASAEQSYDQILSVLSQQDPTRSALIDRLAASIYQQGELQRTRQYLAVAIGHYLRVIEKTPNSPIRLNAQYDAATYLLELKEWQQSSELLEDFRTRFPTHELTATVQDKLIFVYQQSERWLPAADELKRLWESQQETEEGRQALYVAAQYYQKVGNRLQSLEAYRTYAHRYPLPFDEAMEAKFIMSEFYRESSESTKRRFWLKRLMLSDSTAGADRTDRSRYLAAMSSMVFANDNMVEFKKIRLTLPLKSSLKKKRTALDKTLKAFNQTLDYKVAEFSTAASFNIAEIYHQLARDLIASDRPKGLSALEIEQYNILLEEQSYPFEEQAIKVHEVNIQRSWRGVYDDWVKQSFVSLGKLMPGRYDKPEALQENVDEIF
jgi:tetratricopeptide (TPR) repeat protein